jgi:ABC-type xylose transport system permease subunit
LPVIYLSGSVILLLAVGFTDLPNGALLGLVAAIPAAMAVRWAWQDPQTFYRHQPAQAAALIAFVLLATGISIGV